MDKVSLSLCIHNTPASELVQVIQVYHEGDTVLSVGAPPSHYCIVVQGRLGMHPSGEVYGSRRLSTGPLQAFGELELMHNTPLCAALVAERDSIVLLLAASDWRSIIAGGLTAELEDKLHFIASLQQFSGVGLSYIRANVLPALEVLCF